jgi:hypothetical protein
MAKVIHSGHREVKTWTASKRVWSLVDDVRIRNTTAFKHILAGDMSKYPDLTSIIRKDFWTRHEWRPRVLHEMM